MGFGSSSFELGISLCLSVPGGDGTRNTRGESGPDALNSNARDLGDEGYIVLGDFPAWNGCKAMKIASLNCQALFQSISHSQRRARSKMRVLLRMALKYDAICLQEVHGSSADMDRLATELPEHCMVGTFFDRPAGGCMMVIKKSY